MNSNYLNKKYTLISSILVLILIMFAWNRAYNAYDNDLWWLLATGREIIEHGIPYINPWSMHTGLNVVIQQWLSASILYLIYSSTGFLGIKIFVFLQILVLFFVLLLLEQVSSKGECSISVCLVIILISFISISVYSSSRPHLWTMIIYTLLLIVLEKYRIDKNKRRVFLIPLLVLVHANMHISMAPFDLFIIFAYCIPTTLFSKINISFSENDYPRKPLFIILIISVITLLINPYGINGALYLFKSYGVARFYNYISEMNSTVLWSTYGISALISMIVGLLIIGSNGYKKINLPNYLLFFVSCILSVQHIRNVWLLPLFSIPIIADGFSRVHINFESYKLFSNRIVNLITSAICIIIIGVFIVPDLHQIALVHNEDDSDSAPTKAVMYMDSYLASNNIKKEDIKLYNTFNIGGFLEWFGYKVYMDPRPELWEPSITGVNENYYKEFVLFSNGEIEPETLVNKYDFDFIIAYDNNGTLNMWLEEGNGYSVVVHGNGYNLWQKDQYD